MQPRHVDWNTVSQEIYHRTFLESKMNINIFFLRKLKETMEQWLCTYWWIAQAESKECVKRLNITFSFEKSKIVVFDVSVEARSSTKTSSFSNVGKRRKFIIWDFNNFRFVWEGNTFEERWFKEDVTISTPYYGFAFNAT